MATNENPLKGFFRQTKAHISLPSAKFNSYSKDVLTYSNDSNELGLKPLTAIDEIALKDPDGLLNGEALSKVIKSCCEGVKDPMKLYINDVNVIMAVLRTISSGSAMNIHITCPSCKVADDYTIDLETLTQNISKLDDEYILVLDELSVYVGPYTLQSHIHALRAGFEESKVIKSFDNPDAYNDHDRVKIISKAIAKLAAMAFDQLAGSVLKIVLPDGTVVDKKEHINEYLKNIDTKISKEIEGKIAEISKIGLHDKTQVECRACEHVWEEYVAFNPSDFFTQS